MFKSRFSFLRVYMNYLFVILFLVISILLILHPDLQLRTKYGNNIAPAIPGFVLLPASIWIFYIAAKWTKFITITHDAIVIKGIFSRHNIERSAIKSIRLFAVNSPGMINGNRDTICTEIELINQEKIILPDLVYSNYYKLKQALVESFKEKIEKFPPGRPKNKTFLNYTDEVYSGNQFTCLNGIMFYGFSIFFIMLLFSRTSVIPYPESLLLMGLVIGLFYAMYGYQMYYFQLTGNNLIVKNHFWFWYRKSYDMNDIIETNFERPYRRSESLRITTSDFKSKLYSAGSLRDKTWAALKQRLDEMNIHVDQLLI